MRVDCPATTLRALSVSLGGWATAQAAQAQWAALQLQAPLHHVAADVPRQRHPFATCAVHRACARTAPPPPCTPPQ